MSSIMKIHKVLFLNIIFFNIKIGASIVFEEALTSVTSLVSSFHCKYYECCDETYIPCNIYQLKNDLKTKLHGQQIAQYTIFGAIRSHVNHANPRKPLVLSLHGLPGSGKNYVVSMIAKALFKLGEKSSHYYFFNGRNDFPVDQNIAFYKNDLKEKIRSALDKCERSVFVFDEVDKMPTGILDVLVPFIDYTSYNENNKSIFIFISNTGSTEIVNRMIELWKDGKDRKDLTLHDFEALITKGAFNEIGGLYKSGTIESKLIDHYIPFLPLEETHVTECIKDSFDHWKKPNPSKEEIQEVLDQVIFGPTPYNLYSTSGCKRLDSKVSSILQRNEFQF